MNTAGVLADLTMSGLNDTDGQKIWRMLSASSAGPAAPQPDQVLPARPGRGAHHDPRLHPRPEPGLAWRAFPPFGAA